MSARFRRWGAVAGSVGGPVFVAGIAISVLGIGEVFGRLLTDLAALLLAWCFTAFDASLGGTASKTRRIGRSLVLLTLIIFALFDGILAVGLREVSVSPTVGIALTIAVLFAVVVLSAGLILFDVTVQRTSVLPAWNRSLPLFMGLATAGVLILWILPVPEIMKNAVAWHGWPDLGSAGHCSVMRSCA
jgi:hypothetical protein